MKKKFYDAGVYAIISRKTGDTYVGATTDIRRRLETHLGSILLGTHKSKLVRNAFKGHSETDIELRILERVEIEENDYRGIYFDRGAREGWSQLMARERHWISKLNASLNKKKRRTIQIIEGAPTSN